MSILGVKDHNVGGFSALVQGRGPRLGPAVFRHYEVFQVFPGHLTCENHLGGIDTSSQRMGCFPAFIVNYQWQKVSANFLRVSIEAVSKPRRSHFLSLL